MAKKKKYDIKNNNGMVDFVMRTGGVFVKSKMPISLATYHITVGNDVTLEDKRGYGIEICVDDTYFFPPADELDVKCEELISDIKETTDEVTE